MRLSRYYTIAAIFIAHSRPPKNAKHGLIIRTMASTQDQEPNSMPICNRQYGGSIKDCHCRLTGPPWWNQCPEEARGVLVPKSVADAMVARNAVSRSEVHAINAALRPPEADAALDQVARAITTADDPHLRRVAPAAPLGVSPISPPGGKSHGFTGSICANCQSTRMVRNGICETCLDCFHSGECA